MWGGEAGCEHEWGKLVGIKQQSHQDRLGDAVDPRSGRPAGGQRHGQEWVASQGQFCQHCNAWRGCLGLEPTPELYVAHLVDIFREVKRVLRDDGVVFLNMGDSYFGGAGSSDRRRKDSAGVKRPRLRQVCERCGNEFVGTNKRRFCSPYCGGIDNSPRADREPWFLKPKDLCGIPWRVAFALQADGWWLRSDIIWHKPNCMPESVRDRPTKAHEYVFLLSKSKRYYYDQDAVREPNHPDGRKVTKVKAVSSIQHRDGERWPNPAGRNRRTVWTIPTQPYSGAHFAVFPERLIEPCIKAGTSERGACLECGAGWVRVVEKGRQVACGHGTSRKAAYLAREAGGRTDENKSVFATGVTCENNTLGWRPTCTCYNTKPFPKIPRQDKDNDETDKAYAARIAPILAERRRLVKKWEPLPTQSSLVFDPFMGAGTTALVAVKLGRAYYGAEINHEYVELANERIEKVRLDIEKAGLEMAQLSFSV